MVIDGIYVTIYSSTMDPMGIMLKIDPNGTFLRKRAEFVSGGQKKGSTEVKSESCTATDGDDCVDSTIAHR